MTAAATTAAAAAAFPYLAKEDDARLVAAAGFAFGFEGIDDSSRRRELLDEGKSRLGFTPRRG